MRDKGERLSSLSTGAAAALANNLLKAELLLELFSECDCVASCRCDRTDLPLRLEDAFTSRTLKPSS